MANEAGEVLLHVRNASTICRRGNVGVNALREWFRSVGRGVHRDSGGLGKGETVILQHPSNQLDSGMRVRRQQTGA